MAEAQAAPEGVETKEETTEVADQFAAADAAADPNPEPEDTQPPSVEDLAARIGWVPQDKFKGPVEKWKPAEQFIVDGHDIQTRTSRELKEMRQTLDTVARTSGAIMAERLAAQHAELSQRYAAAVEKGDPDEAHKLSRAIDNIQQRAETIANPQATPAPETEAWVQKNGKIKADPVAWQRALQVCDAYARTYPQSSVSEQLAYTESVLKRERADLFDDKPPPQTNTNISRNAGGPARSGKTAADLPKEARSMGQDLVDRGLIPNIDAYAKHYFDAAERKA